MRVAAAERPINKAKIGSPTLEIRCVGEGILIIAWSRGVVVIGLFGGSYYGGGLQNDEARAKLPATG